MNTRRVAYSAFLLLGLGAASAAEARVQLRLMPGYSGYVRVRGGQHDLYEGWSFGGRLMFTRGKAGLFFVGYRSLKAQTNYLLIPDPEYTDQFVDIGYRRMLGRNAFFEIAGTGVSSKSDSKSGFGFGGSFGGGLQFMLGKRLVLGVTTQYSVVQGPVSGDQRRMLTQSADVGVNF